nr:hypothetical protein [Candidatus Kuenenia stuttgartiensis]
MCGLDHAKGFIQTELGSCLRIKNTPHLKFCLDELTEKRNRILKIIDEAVRGSSVIEKNWIGRMKTLNFGLPKGSLQESTIDMMKKAGYTVRVNF